jgi:cytoskeletal protein CcmA (bactofilin family)
MIHLYLPKSGLHHGDLHLAHDVEFHGLVTGSVTVPSGMRLRLHGRIAGDLVVQKNAYAAVHGSVSGAVLNQGAEVTILGKAGAIRPESTSAILVNDTSRGPQAAAITNAPAQAAAKVRKKSPRR